MLYDMFLHICHVELTCGYARWTLNAKDSPTIFDVSTYLVNGCETTSKTEGDEVIDWP